MPSTIWVRLFSVPPAWMASTICWSSAVFTSSMNCSGLRFCGSNSAVAMDRSFLEFLAGRERDRRLAPEQRVPLVVELVERLLEPFQVAVLDLRAEPGRPRDVPLRVRHEPVRAPSHVRVNHELEAGMRVANPADLVDV